jgi:DNA-binding CsgD family transcriptional regulator
MAGELPTDPGFVGRHEERAALGDAVGAVRRGEPRTIIVEGQAGIGKSTLLRQVIQGAPAAPLLDASGAEWERARSWGVVEQLVRSCPLEWERLPAALLPPYADAPTVGSALVELLGSSFQDGPVLVLVDDAHWADLASLQALTFALRRLRYDPVLALFAARTEHHHTVPEGLWRLADSPRGRHLTLRGLPTDDLVALGGSVGVQLSRPAAARLADHTAGNPLHARALLEELDHEELEGPHGVPLPAPRSFAEVVVRRVGRCPPTSRRLAAAAAVLGARSPVVTAAELAGVGDPPGALEPLVAAKLVTTHRHGASLELRFGHALVRAAVYHAQGPAQLERLHRRAAALIGDERLALRHREAASRGHDDDLAERTEDFGRRQQVRGSWAVAAEAFSSAARLSSDAGDRERRLMEAADAALLAGDSPTVQHLLELLEADRDSAHRRYVQARIALVTATCEGARRLTDLAWHLCDTAVDRDLAARIASLAALLDVNDGRPEESLAWARRAFTLSDAPPPDARLALLLSLSAVGRVDEVARLAAAVPDPPPVDVPSDQVDVAMARGILRLWAGDPGGATSDLAAVHGTCARRGPFHTGQIALFYLADAQYRAGDWDAAIASAQTAVSAIQDAEQPWFDAFVHAAAAFPLAGRGEFGAAIAHLTAAQAGARARGDMATRVWAATAAARVAHAQGDLPRVLEVIAPIRCDLTTPGGRDPGMQPWALLLCEALIATGRTDAAREILDGIEEGEERPSVLLVTRGLRGMLRATVGDEAAAEEAFQEALEQAERSSEPFPRALLELAYGAALRRAGRRRPAGGQLSRARERLQVLGARPYLARCARELAACGLPPAGGRRDGHEHLTPQELAVAHLVANGSTNREAATELVVSVKAVEYHLSNIYRKLRIRSRTELALRMRASPDRGPGDLSGLAPPSAPRS